MRFPSTISVIGLGLIGGSLALALKDRARVVAYDPDREASGHALAAGIQTKDLPECVHQAELVFLAAPVGSIPLAGLKIAPYLRPGTIVTDVGSTKAQVVRDLQNHLPRHCLYVGGHPMAGSERSGFPAAREDLFRDTTYIITPTANTHPRAIEVLLEIVKALDARPFFMDIAEHDRLVALISHLPFLISTVLARTILEASEVHPEVIAIASGGFRDMSRLASSDPSMSSDFCVTNKDSLCDAVNLFLQHLDKVCNALQSSSGDLKPLLMEAKAFRDSLAAVRGW